MKKKCVKKENCKKKDQPRQCDVFKDLKGLQSRLKHLRKLSKIKDKFDVVKFLHMCLKFLKRKSHTSLNEFTYKKKEKKCFSEFGQLIEGRKAQRF